jgi:hypothetical protein
MSHRIALVLFRINGEDDQFSGHPKLRYDDTLLLGNQSIALDEILYFLGPTITLLLDNLTGEYNTLDVKDAQSVVVHFLFGVQRQNVLTAANVVAYPVQRPSSHGSILLQLRYRTGNELRTRRWLSWKQDTFSCSHNPTPERQRHGKAVLQNIAEHLFQPQLRRLAATRNDRNRTQLPPHVGRGVCRSLRKRVGSPKGTV